MKMMKMYPYLVVLGEKVEEKLFDPPIVAAAVILFCFVSFIIGLLVL